MRFILKTYFRIIFCITILSSFTGFAAKEKVISSATGSAISALSGSAPYTLMVEDQKLAFMKSNTYWNCRFNNRTSNVSVVLRYDDSKRNLNNMDWVLHVTYDIKLYQTGSTPFITFSSQTASINFNKASGSKYTDIFLKTYENALKAELIITGVSWTPAGGSSASSIPSAYTNDIFLDLIQETDRYYDFNYNGSNCTPAALKAPVVTTPITSLQLNQAVMSASNNQLPIAWNFVEGAESYDVEWLFIDVPDALTFSAAYDADFTRATRINTSMQHYEIPMAYPSGILIYRVRGVGYKVDEPYVKRAEGAWSVTGNSTTALSPVMGTSYMKYFEGLDVLYNWQYSASFAEDGKRKEVISYFDGSLRNRQSATLLNSDNNAVIAESKYDFQGRPTVNILPTPVSSTGIHYYSNFNPNFNKYDFDVDGNYITGVPSPAKLDNTSSTPDQTAVYYGPNTNATGTDAYIPNSQGNAYTQTVLKNDGTGRVSAQSGVGSDHKLGSGHETKYYYVSPTGQEELDRLFGNEVGNVSHYKKNLVFDANGQASVTYHDQEGRVIASALAGTNPDNLLPIDGRPAPDSITADLLTGKNHVFGDGRSSMTAIGVDSPNKIYKFEYVINWDTACTAPPCMICDSCVYDIDIAVLDENRNYLHSISNVVTTSNLNTYSTGSVSYNLTNGPIVRGKGIRNASFVFEVKFITPGVYYIEKSNHINTAALNRYVGNYKAALATAPCGPLPVISANCDGDGTCTEICNDTYGISPNTTPYAPNNVVTTTKYGAPVSLATDAVLYNTTLAEYNTCVSKCNDLGSVGIMDECTLKFMALTKDMSPGGQYFDNKMDLIEALPENSPGVYPACSPNNYPATYTSGNCQDSWLNANITGSAGAQTAFWNTLKTFITNSASGSACALTTFTASLPTSWPGWSWVRANWRTCFADVMVKLHPEYCAYSYNCDRTRALCFKMQEEQCVAGATLGDSKDFDHAMKVNNLSGGSGSNTYFNPTTLSGAAASAISAGYPVTGSTMYISNLDNTSPSYTTSVQDPYFICGDQTIYCKNDFSKSFDAAVIMKDYLGAFMMAYDCPSCYPSSLPPTLTPIVSTTPKYNFSIWYVLDDPHQIAANGKNAIPGITLDPATVSFFEQIHGNSSIVGLLNNSSQPTTKYELFKTWYKGKKDFLFYAGQYSYNCSTSKVFDESCDKIPVSAFTNTYTALAQDSIQGAYTPASNSLPYAQIRFLSNPVYEAMLSDCPAFSSTNVVTALSTLTASAVSDNCASTCAGFADNWMQEIQLKINQCYTGGTAPAIPATLLAHIRTDLITICSGSCDGTHVQGQDHVGASVSASDGSGASISSFDDVYAHYLGAASAYSFCSNLIHTINISHPPQAFSLAGCTCQNLKQFALDKHIVCDGNSTFNQQMADSMNAFFDFDPVLDASTYVTSTDVASWMSACFESTGSCFRPKTGVSMSTFTTTTHPLPLSLNCTDINATDTQEPDACAQAVADAAYQTAYAQLQYTNAKVAAFLSHFKQKCVDALLSNEKLYSKYEINEYNYTLYYYDQAGNLIKTVPPEGVHPLPATNIAGTFPNINTANVRDHRLTPASSSTPFIWPYHTMVTNYKYNTLDQLREQLTPDGGKTNFYYDRVGRLVLSQNAKQAAYASKAFSYTIYDKLSRIKEVGELTNSTTITNEFTKDTNNLKSFMSSYGVKRQVTRTYYDEAPSELFAGTTINFIQSANTKGLYASGIQGYLRNRVSCVTFMETDFNHNIAYNAATSYYDNATHYSYDIHGNVKTLYSENKELSAFNYDLNKIDYDYDLISGKVNEVHYNPGKPDQFHHRYDYDADNRITATYTSRNNLTWEKEAKYFYYKHGPLARTELGDKQVQASDYAYTLQGWIKGVNSNAMSSTNDIGKDGYVPPASGNLNAVFANDAYGYSLGYYAGDYNPKNTAIANSFLASTTDISGVLYPASVTGTSQSAGLFNGNIANMVSSVYLQNTPGVFTASPQLRIFRYDQLNRIKKAYAYDNLDAAANKWTSSGAFGNKYHEAFSYDFNGNINTLKRYDHTGTLMDDLNYNYTPNQAVSPAPSPGISYRPDNKLRYVTENAAVSAMTSDIEDQASGNYDYDGIGNLIKDNAEGIDNIEWTVYGKLKKITRTTSSASPDLEFVYDASGNRIVKIVKPHATLTDPTSYQKTYYVRDAQGNVMATYKQETVSGTAQLSLSDRSIYGSSRLGLVQGTERMDVNPEIAYQTVFKTGLSHSFAGDLATLSLDAEERLKVSVNASSLFGGTKVNLPALTVGRTYEVSYDLDRRQAGDYIIKALALDNTQAIESAKETALQGSNSFRFTAQTASGYLKFQNESVANPAFDFYLDNITVKEVVTERELGDKAYEQSNHLGNVLTTLSDRKIAVSGPGIMTVMSRIFDDNDFSSVVGDPPSCVSLSANAALVNPTAAYSGINFDFPTNSGQIYTVEFDLDKGNSDVSDNMYATLYDNTFALLQFNSLGAVNSGHYSYTWTGSGSQDNIKIYFIAGTNTPGAGALTPHYFSIDNFLVTTTDPGVSIVDHYTADILSATDYYAFGSPMPGRQFNNGSYKYGFNGKEKDDEISGTGNDYSFEYRMYDARLGKFLSVDPAAFKYPYFTPYGFAADNPIRYIDVLGLGPGDKFQTEEQAAYDFATNYNGASIKENKEYLTVIIKVTTAKEVYYTYATPKASTKNDEVSGKFPTKKNEAIVADAHTHGAWEAEYYYLENGKKVDDNNTFSTGDKYGADGVADGKGGNEGMGINGYLATPEGKFKKYDPKANKITTYKNNPVPADPKMAEKKAVKDIELDKQLLENKKDEGEIKQGGK